MALTLLGALAFLVSLWVARKLARLALTLAFLGYAAHLALPLLPRVLHALH
jgi:hypothetical protein